MATQSKSQLSVGVIIPTYNRARYLRQAIASALAQSRMPTEVIVIDDGSTDETPEILREFAAPVRVIRQSNRGRSAARNVGLLAATTDAVIFLDSDDILLPTCIERLIAPLEANPSVDVAYGDAQVIDAKGNIAARYGDVYAGNRPSGNVFAELAQRCFLTVTSMVRRIALAGVDFDEGLERCEDYDLWRRIACRGEFQYVDEPIMAYRFHDGMTMASQIDKNYAAIIDVQQRFMAMPEFAALSARQRSRVYCTHAIKLACVNRTGEARRALLTAIRACPLDPMGHFLLAVSAGGSKALTGVTALRSKLAAHRYKSRVAPLDVVGHDTRQSQTTAPASTISRDINGLTAVPALAGVDAASGRAPQ